MARIPAFNRTLSSTIPFARGVADRAARTAVPIVADVVGRVASRLPRRPRTERSTPEAFTPSPAGEGAAVEGAEPPVTEPVEPATEPPAEGAGQHGAPSPAIVARNAAGPRPTAKSPAKRKPRSVPGAKLPVTRPSS